MKRAVLVGAPYLALVLATSAAAAVVGCHPKEPKQAASVDPVTDDSSSPSGGSSSGGSSGGSRGGDNIIVPPPGGAATGPGGKPATAKGEATQVNSLSAMMENLRWGMS